MIEFSHRGDGQISCNEMHVGGKVFLGIIHTKYKKPVYTTRIENTSNQLEQILAEMKRLEGEK